MKSQRRAQREIGRVLLVAGCLAAGVTSARAEEPGDASAAGRTTLGRGTPSEELPPPRSDHDPAPPAAKPTLPRTTITKQAGVGGTQAYGRPGVLELGGSAGFGAASNYTRLELSPSIGYFIVDNVQLSLLGALNHFAVGAVNGNDESSVTELRLMIEPSYHLPFTDTIFGFAGLGAGANYVSGHEAGFAWQPRIGANFLVGRSGILTPSLSMTYSTVEAFRTPNGALLAVQTTYGLNVGYTVMW
jgi:hypothetical protein